MNEARLLREGLRVLRDRLPPGWKQEASFSRVRAPDQPDVVLRITGPDGSKARVLVEAKNRIFPRDVAQLKTRLSRYFTGPSLVVAGFLTPTTRRRLQEEELNYLDVTGNLRLILSRPGLHLETPGASEDPAPGEASARSLRGQKAGRLVRALCDFPAPPRSPRSLRRLEVDVSYASRLVEVLARDGVPDQGAARSRRGGGSSRDHSAMGRGLLGPEEQWCPALSRSSRTWQSRAQYSRESLPVRRDGFACGESTGADRSSSVSDGLCLTMTKSRLPILDFDPQKREPADWLDSFDQNANDKVMHEPGSSGLADEPRPGAGRGRGPPPMDRSPAGVKMADPLYVVAREVLLDALEALADHRESIVLVGAQAIYLHTGNADMAVPAFTTDGDLLIEPARLKPAPKIGDVMARAHFRRGLQPGSWLCDRMVGSVPATIPVDLLVPEARSQDLAGRGARGEHGTCRPPSSRPRGAACW